MSGPDDDSYIEKSRAPLLEHLVELRGRLFTCVYALVAGFIVTFIFRDQLLGWLIHPWTVASGLMELQARQGGHQNYMSLDTIKGAMGLMELPKPRPEFALQMISTAPLETFMSKIKLAAFGAVVIAFPVLAFQIYRFVAPGLYKRERFAFLPFLLAAPVLFVMGGALVYYVLLPFMELFSLNQQSLGTQHIVLMPKISDYLSLVVRLILGFGICFQLPILLSLLGLAGIVNSQQLRAFWRFAVVGIFGLAGLFTPADPISMLALALPLVLLYEVSIWSVKIMEFRRRKADAAEDVVS